VDGFADEFHASAILPHQAVTFGGEDFELAIRLRVGDGTLTLRTEPDRWVIGRLQFIPFHLAEEGEAVARVGGHRLPIVERDRDFSKKKTIKHSLGAATKQSAPLSPVYPPLIARKGKDKSGAPSGLVS